MIDLADSADERRLVEQATRVLHADSAPCPGCGRSREELEIVLCHQDLCGNWYRVRCEWCDWCGPEAKNPHHAVGAWNKRSASAPPTIPSSRCWLCGEPTQDRPIRPLCRRCREKCLWEDEG